MKSNSLSALASMAANSNSQGQDAEDTSENGACKTCGVADGEEGSIGTPTANKSGVFCHCGCEMVCSQCNEPSGDCECEPSRPTS